MELWEGVVILCVSFWQIGKLFQREFYTQFFQHVLQIQLRKRWMRHIKRQLSPPRSSNTYSIEASVILPSFPTSHRYSWWLRNVSYAAGRSFGSGEMGNNICKIQFLYGTVYLSKYDSNPFRHALTNTSVSNGFIHFTTNQNRSEKKSLHMIMRG